jgi:Carboxypeptidase regulatory-like domain
MIRRTLISLSLLGAVATASGQPPPPPPSQRPGEVVRPAQRPSQPATEGSAVVRGRVTAADGRPLRLARVGIVETNTRRSMGDATDENGQYEFTDLPPGTYTITARKAGFATMEYGQRRPADPGRRIRVVDGQTVERIDLVLPSASTMTGRVVDENGDPVEDATVSIYTMSIVGGRRRLVSGGANRRTDDFGRFRLFSVDPGEYVLAAAAANTGLHRLPGYAPAYFPGTPSVIDAQVLAVKAGDELAGLDLRLMPGRAAKISGSVVDSTGQPLEGELFLDASRRSGALAAPAIRHRPNANGDFELVNIAPGDYVLQASGRGRNGIEFTTRFLVVGEDDIGGVIMRTSTGSVVSGRMTVEGSRSRVLPRDFQFNFLTANEDFSPDPGVYRARIGDDWTFEYDGLFGMLLIRPSGRPEWLLRSVRVNGVDVTDTPLSFGRREDSLTDVEVILTNQGAEVSGSAIDPRGQTGLPYTVVVFPVDRERWARHSRFVKVVPADPDGTYTVRGLPTSEYFVAAVDRLQMRDGSGEWEEPAFLEALTAAATRVSLEEGRTGAASPRLVVR